MTGATTIPVDYDGGECINEPTASHPYQVLFVGTAGGSDTYSIVTGATNNVTPGNIASTITVTTGAYDVYIRHPYLSPNFPDATNFAWAISATIPADTDTDGYILIATVNGSTVTQIVTGSLWADRLKLGTQTAQYYFARV
jgi:hypothetical protein